MKEHVFKLGPIPAILYGEEGEKVYLFVHGKCGYKEEGKDFAQLVCPLGWQVLAIDLPEHGARKGETDSFDPWHVVPELRTVMAFARQRWSCVALRATSIGAWFSMLAFSQEPLERCLLVSPVLNMEHLIQRMMGWAEVPEEQLAQQKTIQTSFGQTLSWRYYQYAKEHPIEGWDVPTAILYAGQDDLTPQQEVGEFTARFQCDLTVLEDGEHWFHTPQQLDVLRKWTVEKAAGERAAFQTSKLLQSGNAMTEVVAALIWDGNRFMACQRPAHKARGLMWEFVGGKVEPGETKEQALVRECREELAVTVAVGEVFMEVVHEYPDLTVHLTLFHAAIAQGTPRLLEHNDLRWVTVAEMDQLEFCPADEAILNRLREQYQN